MSRGWSSLPPEMSLSILDLLSLQDVKAFSVLSRPCRQLAMSTLFKVGAPIRDLTSVCIPTFPSLPPVCQTRWPRSCPNIPLPIPVHMPHPHSITLCFYATPGIDATTRLRWVSNRPPRHPFIHLHHDSIPHTLRLWLTAKTHRPPVLKIDPSDFAVHRDRRT